MPQIANTTPSTSTHAAPTSSRARNTGGPRKRVNPAADDATYHGTTSLNVGAGAKRGATDKADGEPRTKRKRVDHGGAHATVSGSGVRRGGVDRTVDANEKLSLVSNFVFWIAFFASFGVWSASYHCYELTLAAQSRDLNATSSGSMQDPVAAIISLVSLAVAKLLVSFSFLCNSGYHGPVVNVLERQ